MKKNEIITIMPENIMQKFIKILLVIFLFTYLVNMLIFERLFLVMSGKRLQTVGNDTAGIFYHCVAWYSYETEFCISVPWGTVHLVYSVFNFSIQMSSATPDV